MYQIHGDQGVRTCKHVLVLPFLHAAAASSKQLVSFIHELLHSHEEVHNAGARTVKRARALSKQHSTSVTLGFAQRLRTGCLLQLY